MNRINISEDKNCKGRGVIWYFSQIWYRRNTSSTSPFREYKRTSSSMNKLNEIAVLRKGKNINV
jgi:hypothetical protein